MMLLIWAAGVHAKHGAGCSVCCETIADFYYYYTAMLLMLPSIFYYVNVISIRIMFKIQIDIYVIDPALAMRIIAHNSPACGG